ncbi:hypothetical protein NOVOSPHI9U_200023 [Novosphingobium sp. 9U]|nr:hypothetical protein NOVOSPHI9U_200023 [Novosphingobium sp. 9U]
MALRVACGGSLARQRLSLDSESGTLHKSQSAWRVPSLLRQIDAVEGLCRPRKHRSDTTLQ